MAPLLRKADLSPLAQLITSPAVVQLFRAGANRTRQASVEGYEQLLHLLTPWVIGQPPAPMRTTNPPKLMINCSSLRYAKALRPGPPVDVPARIIALVPFGYDIDLLEIRLAIQYDYVDAFIVYEQPFTNIGLRKPLWFHESLQRSPARWAPYADKILHLIDRLEDLAFLAAKAAQSREGGKSDGWGSGWGMEEAMRTRPFALLRNSSAPLAKRILDWAQSDDKALILQHDGDEVPTAPTVAHLKWCPLLRTTVRLPMLSPQDNLEYYETWSNDSGKAVRFGGNAHEFAHMELPHQAKFELAVLNDLRPYATRLRWVLQQGALPRKPRLPWRLLPRNLKGSASDHMGPAAAIHFSSIFRDPAREWLKRMTNAHSKAPYDGTVLPSDVVGIIVRAEPERLPRAVLGTVRACQILWRHPRHVSTFSEPTQQLIKEAVPWVLAHNPERYPFLWPSADEVRCSWRSGAGRGQAEQGCAWTGPAWAMPQGCRRFLS